MAASLNERWNWTTDPEHLVEMVEPYLIYGGAVLDFGCGLGRVMKPLAAKHYRTEFIGYDISEEAIGIAAEDARSNETYVTPTSATFIYDLAPKLDLRSAYSILVFQHLPDEQVYDALRFVYPAPFRFQFALGDVKAPDNYQRETSEMAELCRWVGYETWFEADPVYETWQWCTASC